MTFSRFLTTAMVLPLLTVALAPAAYADKGGNGHGNGKSNDRYERSYYDDRVVIINNDRTTIRNYMREDYRSHCPPGLAKKHNGCQPPGQAKKRYIVGYPLPRDIVITPISNDLRRHLQPVPRGYQYVRVDNDVLLIAEASKKVIDAVTLLSAVGN